MIQIITKNNYSDKFSDKYVISNFDNFEDMNNFEINIIDLNNSNIWKYDGRSTKTINEYKKLNVISNAIKSSENKTVIILYPQNISFDYYYGYNDIGMECYIHSDKIKDITYDINDIINNSIYFFTGVETIYGKSILTSNDEKLNADFKITTKLKENKILISDNGKSCVAIKQDNVILSTLELNNEKQYDLFLKLLLENSNIPEPEPEWIKDIVFYNDKELTNQREELENKINEIQMELNKIIEEEKRNSHIKSILYGTGDDLALKINNILSKLLDYDLSGFVDKSEEDGLIKLDTITFVIETKGLKNEISGHNISDAYNHLILYDDDLDKENKKENTKCLFVVANERLKAIDERSEIKDRIKILAEANKTLIITTDILLKIYSDFLFNKINTNEVIELFSNNVGILKYPNKDK